MPQGQSWAPPSSSESSVNTGTVLALASLPRIRRGGRGWVHRRPIGSGRGGAAVVLRAGESPAHGEGRQQESRSEDAARPKDAPANAGAPPRRRRVSEMQADLHRPAFGQDGRPCGEPGAVRVARRVRRAAWGNGPAAMPAPRPRPTQPRRGSARAGHRRLRLAATGHPSRPGVLQCGPGRPRRTIRGGHRPGPGAGQYHPGHDPRGVPQHWPVREQPGRM
jgi:hypothetical protein